MFIHRLAITFLLLGLLFKAENILATSTLFSIWPPLVQQVKANSWLLLAAYVAASSISFISRRPFFISNSPALLFLTLFLIASLRASVYDTGLGAKTFLGALIFTYILLAEETSMRVLGLTEYTRCLLSAMLYSSAILIVVNLWLYLTGYGYGTYAARFYGTSIHPNFIGIQLAISSTILFWVYSNVRNFPKALAGALLIAGLYLLVLTGSRTAIVAAVIGIMVCLSRDRNFIVALAIAFPIVLAPLYFLLNQESSTFSALDRGGVGFDTRSEVWRIMFEEFLENPIFGAGMLEDASESSYLRSFATYGFIHGVILLCACYTLIGRLSALSRQAQQYRAFLAIAACILVGGIFEGYLTDALSYPLALTFLCALISAHLHQTTPTISHQKNSCDYLSAS